MNDPVTASIVTGIFAVIGTIVGAVLGACVTIYITARTIRSEEQRQRRELALRERQQFRELGVKVGLENLDYCMKIAQAAANKFNQRFDVPPTKAFIIQGIKMMEIVSDTSLSADEMAGRIAACEDFTQDFVRAAKQNECR